MTAGPTRVNVDPQLGILDHDAAVALSAATPQTFASLLERVYRTESRRILATLIRLLGDFDRAEEALHEAFAVALDRWPLDGVPQNPVTWLVSVGRFKGIDHLRKNVRLGTSLDTLPARALAASSAPLDAAIEQSVPDDHLRLIFICCHPAIAPDARTALTLREVCGLTTEAIARAYVCTPAATAQRIVRAKNKIRELRLPYAVPSALELPSRLASVLEVIYLIFNEGYSASSGEALTRPDLSKEAIRLGRVMRDLLPDAETRGLLGLMLLQESRRKARTTASGELVLLGEQDRALWDKSLITEGLNLARSALGSPRVGRYALQAGIAAVHAEAATLAETHWGEMVALYDLLLEAQPSPIVELNRAVAVSMRDGPEAGLVLVDALRKSGSLGNYHLLYSTRAELCRRLGRFEAAREAYRHALTWAEQAPERRWLDKRLQELV
jgi:RNA polymerase sigma-70 factor (ECF subfamily)